MLAIALSIVSFVLEWQAVELFQMAEDSKDF
jgi:hypothetical protein